MAAIEVMTTTKNRWAHIAASYREPQARRSIAQARATAPARSSPRTSG